MSIDEAQEYADLAIETLHEWGIIDEDKYGAMTDQRETLAKMIAEKSEE